MCIYKYTKFSIAIPRYDKEVDGKAEGEIETELLLLLSIPCRPEIIKMVPLMVQKI